MKKHIGLSLTFIIALMIISCKSEKAESSGQGNHSSQTGQEIVDRLLEKADGVLNLNEEQEASLRDSILVNLTTSGRSVSETYPQEEAKEISQTLLKDTRPAFRAILDSTQQVVFKSKMLNKE